MAGGCGSRTPNEFRHTFGREIQVGNEAKTKHDLIVAAKIHHRAWVLVKMAAGLHYAMLLMLGRCTHGAMSDTGAGAMVAASSSVAPH